MAETNTTSVPAWVNGGHAWERTPIWDEEFAARWDALHGQGEETKPPVVKRPSPGRKPAKTRG